MELGPRERPQSGMQETDTLRAGLSGSAAVGRAMSEGANFRGASVMRFGSRSMPFGP